MGKCLQVDELTVLHLQEHTSDLSGKLRIDGLNLGEDDLTQDLLLLGRLGTGKLRLQHRAVVSLAPASLIGTIGGVVTAISTASTLTIVGRVSRHTTRTSVRRRHTTATLRSAATTHGSLLSLHSSHELRSAGLAVLGRKLSGHTVHVGGHLLGNTTTATLLRVARELTRSTTLDTAHADARLREWHTTATLWYKARLLAVENGRLHVLLRHTGRGSSLLHTQLVASLDTGLELALANILALSQSNIQGLAVDHALVHLSNSLGGIIRIAEADETKALALTKFLVTLLISFLVGVFLLGLLGFLLGLRLLLVVFFLLLIVVGSIGRSIPHHLGGGDGAKLGKHLAELLIIHIVIKVLDVEVDTLLLLTLMLLLGTANVKVLATEVLTVELLDSLGGAFMGGEIDKTEATALALLVTGKRRRRDVTILLEELTELVVGGLSADILDVNVGKVSFHLLKLALTVLLRDVVTDVDLLLVEKHAINVLDGLVSSLVRLVMDKTIALGVAVLVLGNLAAQNVAKGSKGIMESLVVNGNIQVLDEDIALASLAESRVTLRPHDAARAALDEGVIELLQGLLSISSRVVIDVGIAQRATRDGITTDTDGGDSTDLGEELEEHGLGDRGIKLSNVERGGVLRMGSSGARSGSRGVFGACSADGGVDSRLGIAAAIIEGGVVEVGGKLVNSAGGSVGGHFDVENVENR
ncbi:hypothetical protein E5D57_005080 [Metarhizium anisopliae]|nr:hypothetical protein E5D57_005080 [Metarhizium anisopliae]